MSVVLQGFWVTRQSWDHAGNADGWGDEVYMKCGLNCLDAAGASVSGGPRELITPVHGQRDERDWWSGRRYAKWPDRILIGGASGVGHGGLKGGDHYPPYNPWEGQWTPNRAVGNRGFLPLLLWEWGGDASALEGSLVVTPAVWEWDNGRPMMPEWGDAEAKMVEQWGGTIGAGAGGVSGALAAIGLAPAAAAVLAVGGVIVAVTKLIPWFVSVGEDIIGVAGDRPIGQIAEGSTRVYNPQVLSFDLAKIREAAAYEMGKGPGVWWLRVKDDPKIGGGEYEIFVKVNYTLV
ncbi:hypothetical protein [Arthrobacter sp. HMWF013]|uniref:hypothetical protein n=1 Tax=Arthrobacter sp. HMWF013 TaxID=2056849 RepID=UPI0011B22C0B|nr:hypothetical protein [Arthrobacter sp. HMWF013]